MPEGQPEQASASKKRGRNNKKLFIIIGAAAAAAIAVVVILIIINSFSGGKVDIFTANAFFVSDKANGDTKYALFKKDGSKLTDFNFTQVGTFVNGYAYVRNTDGKDGIIRDDGSMSVDFGAYDGLTSHMGIYGATKGDKEILILGNGDELASDYVSYDYASNSPYVVVKTEENKYDLYNALGKRLASFESSEAPSITEDEPETASAVSYKGGLIILSNSNFMPVTTIDGLDAIYDVDEATEDGSIITFYEHNNHYANDAKRAIYNKDSFAELDGCSDLDLHDNFTDEKRIYVTCESDGKDKLVRKNAVTDMEVNSYGGGYAVYDEDHYARYDQENKKSEIYVNGDKKTTLDSNYRITVSARGYQINDFKAKTVTLYDLDGNEVIKLNDAATSSELFGVDANDHVVVRDSKKDNTERYVIVKKNGEEISGRYYSITLHGEYYVASNRTNNTMDLLDKDGKVIVSGEYGEYVFNEDNKYILGRKGDSNNRQYDVIDVEGKSVKATMDGTVTYYKAGYYRTTSDNKTRFYTLDGKLVHEYEN